jgi:hypothetical protein
MPRLLGSENEVSDKADGLTSNRTSEEVIRDRFKAALYSAYYDLQ